MLKAFVFLLDRFLASLVEDDNKTKPEPAEEAVNHHSQGKMVGNIDPFLISLGALYVLSVLWVLWVMGVIFRPTAKDIALALMTPFLIVSFLMWVSDNRRR